MKKEIIENLAWKNKPVKCGKYMKLQDKMNFASEIALKTLTMDQKTDVIYETTIGHVYFLMGAVKAYTDIKVPDDQEKLIKMYDDMRETGFMDAFIEGAAAKDLKELMMIVEKLISNTRKGHEAQNDFGRKVSRMMGEVSAEDATRLALQNEEILGMIRNASEKKPEANKGKIVQFPAGVMKKQIEE